MSESKSMLPAALGKRVADQSEALDLSASETACAVADAWAAMVRDTENDFDVDVSNMSNDLARALDRLESATRGSALRKVAP